MLDELPVVGGIGPPDCELDDVHGGLLGRLGAAATWPTFEGMLMCSGQPSAAARPRLTLSA